MSTHSRTFSRSLEASVAVEKLSQELYVQRCRYIGVAATWATEPYHLRSGFEELAIRMLRSLTEVHTDAADPLFRLSNDLARADARRSHIIGWITPNAPWGESAS